MTADNVVCVKAFLRMLIQRRRYQKIKASAKVIERAYLRFRAKALRKKQAAAIRNAMYLEKLEKYLMTRSDISVFNSAAKKI